MAQQTPSVIRRALLFGGLSCAIPLAWSKPDDWPIHTGGMDVSLKKITSEHILLASSALSGLPLFCGRYFSAVSQEKTLCDASDIDLLGRFQIPILPIARQTNHVSSINFEDGFADGKANAAEFVRIYSERSQRQSTGPKVLEKIRALHAQQVDAKILFMLDVEGGTQPTLTSEYYAGWVMGLKSASGDVGIRFAPAVYLRNSDTKTAEAINTVLADEVADGFGSFPSCAGLWVMRYQYDGNERPLGCRPYDKRLGDTQLTLNCRAKILMHQYTECNEDLDISRIPDTVDTRRLFKLFAPTTFI